MQEELKKTAIRGAHLLALGALALPCAAVTLGDVRVRSALGEPLDVSIPLVAAGGESIERSCFSLLPGNDAGLPGVGEGSVSIERSRAAATLRLRTYAPVLEPAVAMKVRSACPGSTVPELIREYVLLLDPRPTSAAPAPDASIQASSPVPPRGILATVLARIGDTLESLARALIPRSSSARRDYIATMRNANPALQNLGEQDQIPEGTPVALPDMRLATTMRSRPRPEPETAAAAPAKPRERTAAAAPQPSETAAPTRRAPRASPPLPSAREESRAARTPAAVPAQPRREGFVLRLSSPEVDMSRSGRYDEPMRQKLRERQLVLDADDQVSALLAMRNSLKQLETRVAELQLKLASMPPSLAGLTPPPERTAPVATPPAAREPVRPTPPVSAPEKAVAPSPPLVEKAAPPPAPVAVAPVAVPPVVEKAAPSPAPVAVPPVALAPPPAVTPPVLPQESAAPAVRPPSKQAPPASAADPVPPPTSQRGPVPKPIARLSFSDGALTQWLWALVALLVALALWLALRISRRKREEFTEVETVEPELGSEVLVAEEPEPAEPSELPAPPPRPAERPALASDAPLATRLAENSGELRRRYIEERFPEIANGAVALDDPASVVKGARLFYEDGAIPRAVELLQFAIEDRPREMKPWLALFEIFRLERLTGQYAELASRFRKQYGDTEEWRKVRFFGREIEPGNALYREDAINTLETIGPRDARKLALSNASFDPIAENWLAAPMDFENEVLANDLRRVLMAETKLTEQDLAPNPMPALRNVEMFTVA